MSKKPTNKLGFGYRVFIRSGCSSLVSFVVAPAGTHGITVFEHLTLQSNRSMSSCFVCTCVDGLSLNLEPITVSLSQDPGSFQHGLLLEYKQTPSCPASKGDGIWTQILQFLRQVLTTRSLPRSLRINYYATDAHQNTFWLYINFDFKKIKSIIDIRQSPSTYFKGLILYKISQLVLLNFFIEIHYPLRI